ncbi:MAG: helix-turn-helix domain-containing protein [Candidatus Doudnabacteria bacterium]
MYQETLQLLGLSPNEAKIYESLVEQGESSIGKISVNAKVHRRNVYDSIQRLIEKGLCFEIFSKGENRYNAVDPGKLSELIAEKQDKLNLILPMLEKKFRSGTATEEAYIYRGLEGQKNIFRDMLRVSKDSYFIGAKGGWFDPRIETARKAFFKEANRKNIKFIQLFEYDVRTQLPNFPQHFPGKLQYRFLPKAYATNSAIHIFGDYVVTYTGLPIGKINEDTVFFILHSKDLAESYRTWFWYMWEQSEEDRKSKK